MLVNPTYMWKKVSLNKHMYNKILCGPVGQNVATASQEPNSVPPRNTWSIFANSVYLESL